MQIGQRFFVSEPFEFGHKALDEPKHALGAVDESALDFARVGISVGITALVEETLGSPCLFRRGQIEKGQEISGLVMRALLLELSAALDVDQRRRHVREMAFGILAGGLTLRFDKYSPARAEPAQRVIQPAGDADQLRRHGGIQIWPSKPRGTLKRAVLVEDDALVDQSGPGQEVSKLCRRPPVFSEVHHGLKPPDSRRYADAGARHRRIGGHAWPPTPQRPDRESRARDRRATAADRGRAPPPACRLG